MVSVHMRPDCSEIQKAYYTVSVCISLVYIIPGMKVAGFQGCGGELYDYDHSFILFDLVGRERGQIAALYCCQILH